MTQEELKEGLMRKKEAWNAERDAKKMWRRAPKNIILYVCALCQNKGTSLAYKGPVMVCQGGCKLPKACMACHDVPALATSSNGWCEACEKAHTAKGE